MQVAGSAGLVTGGASGLGRAVVEMLVEGGARAAILDLPESSGAAIAEELGDAAIFVPVDVRDTEQVAAAVATAADAFGRIDVVVGCAGVSPHRQIFANDGKLFPIELFRRTVDINLNGLFDVACRVAEQMVNNTPREDGERGLIVNVASIAGYEGQIGQTAYAASKGGVIALTLPLARDLAEYGIRVMGIAPGMVNTPMLASAAQEYRDSLADLQLFPSRFGRPSEVAALVRSFMEIALLNGEVVRLDAGVRLPPR